MKRKNPEDDEILGKLISLTNFADSVKVFDTFNCILQESNSE